MGAMVGVEVEKCEVRVVKRADARVTLEVA
jgi:hypothetical protein